MKISQKLDFLNILKRQIIWFLIQILGCVCVCVSVCVCDVYTN